MHKGPEWTQYKYLWICFFVQWTLLRDTWGTLWGQYSVTFLLLGETSTETSNIVVRWWGEGEPGWWALSLWGGVVSAMLGYNKRHLCGPLRSPNFPVALPAVAAPGLLAHLVKERTNERKKTNKELLILIHLLPSKLVWHFILKFFAFPVKRPLGVKKRKWELCFAPLCFLWPWPAVCIVIPTALLLHQSTQQVSVCVCAMCLCVCVFVQGCACACHEASVKRDHRLI